MQIHHLSAWSATLLTCVISYSILTSVIESGKDPPRHTLPYGKHTRGYFYLPHADLTGLDQYRVQRSAHVRDQVPKICAGNETLALIVSCKHGGISSFYFTLRKIPKQKLDWKSVCVRGLQRLVEFSHQEIGYYLTGWVH